MSQDWPWLDYTRWSHLEPRLRLRGFPHGAGHQFLPLCALLSHGGPSLHQTSASSLSGFRGCNPFIPRITSGGRPGPLPRAHVCLAVCRSNTLSQVGAGKDAEDRAPIQPTHTVMLLAQRAPALLSLEEIFSPPWGSRNPRLCGKPMSSRKDPPYFVAADTT